MTFNRIAQYLSYHKIGIIIAHFSFEKFYHNFYIYSHLCVTPIASEKGNFYESCEQLSVGWRPKLFPIKICFYGANNNLYAIALDGHTPILLQIDNYCAHLTLVRRPRYLQSIHTRTQLSKELLMNGKIFIWDDLKNPFRHDTGFSGPRAHTRSLARSQHSSDICFIYVRRGTSFDGNNKNKILCVNKCRKIAAWSVLCVSINWWLALQPREHVRKIVAPQHCISDMSRCRSLFLKRCGDYLLMNGAKKSLWFIFVAGVSTLAQSDDPELLFSHFIEPKNV